MPYIPKHDKEKLDPFIDGIIEQLKSRPTEQYWPGLVTYVIYELLRRVFFKPEARYKDMAEGLGCLKGAEFAIEQDFLKPYEYRKKVECGWYEEQITGMPAEKEIKGGGIK